MGLGAGLDGTENLPHRESIPGPSSPLRVAVPTALSRASNYSCANTMSLQKVTFGDVRAPH